MADETALDANLNFEEALAALEAVVRQMEAGALPLEDLISQYEQGMKLALFCRKKLENLERKIEILTRDNGAGGEWKEFQPDNSRMRNENTGNC